MRSHCLAAATMVALSLVLLVSEASGATADEFTLSITPYAWFAGVTGTIGIKGIKVDVDKSFLDIWDESDTLLGFFGRAEGHYGRFGLYADGGYMQIGVDKISGPLGIANVSFSNHIGLVDFGLMYRLIQPAPGDYGFSLDATAGAHYWTMGLEVDPANFPSRTGGVGWFDPTIGARGTVDIGRHLEFVLGGDVGGFDVASQFTWSAVATVGYVFDIGKVQGSVFAGYKAIGDDYTNGGFTWDTILHGPIIGLRFTF